MEKSKTKNLEPVESDLQESAHSTPNAGAASGALGRIRIVLCQPRHPGNVGAVARAMKTMGLSRLYLVAPERMVDGLPDAEAEARASGAGDVLAGARFCASLGEALTGVSHAAAVTARRREIGPPQVTARAAAQRLAAAARTAEVALVFGNETAGLTNDQVMRCDLCVAIPTDPEFSSLNLGAAAQVMSYELRQAVVDVDAGGSALAAAASPLVADAAPREEIERFFVHLERTMIATGFLDPLRPKRLLPKLRRLFGRTGLEREEINILRGFLSAIEAPPGRPKGDKNS